MSIPISLGSGLTLKFKYRNGRTFASIVQHGQMAGRPAPILFTPLLGLDREVTDDRVGYHVLRRTYAEPRRDAPDHVESRIILARYDGEHFIHCSPTQVGREGGPINLNAMGTRFDRVILPAALKRYLLSYPNAPTPPRKVIATQELDDNITVIIAGDETTLQVTIRDKRTDCMTARDSVCALTDWAKINEPPRLHGFYLLRSYVMNDDLSKVSTVYQMAYFNGTNFMVTAADDGAYIFRFQGNPLNDNWAGITRECSLLLNDIIA